MDRIILADLSQNVLRSPKKLDEAKWPIPSASDSVKLRPRKQAANKTICGKSGHIKQRKVKIKDAKGLETGSQGLLTALHPKHVDELLKIWNADKRTPTVESRRAWALARQIKPDILHRWWHTRKALAAKAHKKLPQGTYELPVGTPPVIDPVVKKEVNEDDLSQILLPRQRPTTSKPFLASESSTELGSSDCDTHAEITQEFDDKTDIDRAYSSLHTSISSKNTPFSRPQSSSVNILTESREPGAYTDSWILHLDRPPGTETTPRSFIDAFGDYYYPLYLTTQHDVDLQMDLLVGPPIPGLLEREQLVHDSTTTCSAFICIGPNGYAYDGSYIGPCLVFANGSVEN